MLLVIDVGNTNIVLGVFDGPKLVADWRIATRQNKTDDEYGIQFKQLFSLAGLQSAVPSGCILASVVPPLQGVIERACKKYFGQAPLVVEPGIKTGMSVLYENPREVGADRIVNAVAAYEQWKCGLIVVDFGTATTFDLVTPKGEYLGGVICPGIGISAEALFMRAAKLPRIDLTAPKSAIGRNTVDSMRSGLVYGYAEMVDGLIRRLRDELPYENKVIATGGHAAIIAEHSQSIAAIEPRLTLYGLRIIYELNRK